ncbi:MAG: hypothetical protein ACREJS_16665, partial [Candidatus Rokuibacteriota bacterium]
SLYRYFQWADDMRRQFLALILEGPVGRMQRAGLTKAEAFARVQSDAEMRGLLLALLYAFPYMSYYYGGMYAVIEAWGTPRFPYSDPGIDTLLQSPLVARLERHRNGAFHAHPEYFDDRLLEFVNEMESEEWLDCVHAAFARWFRYNLKLTSHEGPQGR